MAKRTRRRSRSKRKRQRGGTHDGTEEVHDLEATGAEVVPEVVPERVRKDHLMHTSNLC